MSPIVGHDQIIVPGIGPEHLEFDMALCRCIMRRVHSSF
jgi:hypothetical protein